MGTPAFAADNVTSCSFSADGGTFQQNLVVSLASGGSVNITKQISPNATSLVKQSAGFVLRPNINGDYESSLPWGAQFPADLGTGGWAMVAPDRVTAADITNYWLWDMSGMFGWAEGLYSPETHYVAYRYYAVEAPYSLLCSITVDYSPSPAAVNYGHSDKQAAAKDRNRLYFSEDPSGSKPKKK